MCLQGKELGTTKMLLEYRRLSESPETRVIKLNPLGLCITRAFMEGIAEGRSIPDAVVNAVLDKSSGVPMFVEQVTLYLMDKGLLRNFTMSLQTSLQTPLQTTFAYDLIHYIKNKVSVDHVIFEQMNTLAPSTQLTLKVAAVMGTNITLDALLDSYIVKTTKESLEKDLAELEEAGLLHPSISTPGSWQFTTMMARDIIYKFIPKYMQQQVSMASCVSLFEALRM